MENRSGSGRSHDGRRGPERSRSGESRGQKRSYSPRGKYEDRGKSRHKGPRRDSGDSRSGQNRDKDAAPREKVLNPSDLRSSNRPDRARSPEIDAEVTGKELDKAVKRELASLDEHNQPWVSKHLVMAGRLIDIDPQLAFEHALAASRRGGRIGAVREAVAVTAYAAGDFAEALREFRTYRRITGENIHLAEMVDCERALGRPEKALESAIEADLSRLPASVRAELAMVVSGTKQDQGDLAGAVAALEIGELNPKRAFSYSPRLFTAYAEALENVGRKDEAKRWRHLALAAEEALGQGFYADPEIIDFDDEIEEEAQRKPLRARDVVPPGTLAEPPESNER